MFVPTSPPRRPMRHTVRKHRPMMLPPYCDRDRVSQLAVRIATLIEPALADTVHGWRKRHSVITAVDQIASLPGARFGFDIERFFPSIDQAVLKRKLDRLDPSVWGEIEPWLPDSGLCEGAAFNPTLGNLYLADLDHRFPTAVRYADNILIVHASPDRVFRQMSKQLGDIGLRCHQIEPNPNRFCKTPLPPLT